MTEKMGGGAVKLEGKKLNTSLQLDRVNEILRDQFAISKVSHHLGVKV